MAAMVDAPSDVTVGAALSVVLDRIEGHEAASAVVRGYLEIVKALAPVSEEVSVSEYPVLLHTVIDAADCRGLAEFYRQLLGLRYRDGEEPPSGR